MRIACITTSVVPSTTANSIQAMKVVHALYELGNDVRLWVPEFKKSSWEQIQEIYGLRSHFDITWKRFHPFFKQYDFAWKSVSEAGQWDADVIYTWTLQAAVFAQLGQIPTVMEFHDFPMGRIGPKLFKIYAASKGKKLSLCTTRALAEGIQEKFGVGFASDELQIAPNGSDVERYKDLPNPEKARQMLNLKPGFTVGYSGHFYAGRGMELLMEIACSLPEVNFLWVGGRSEDIQLWRERIQSKSVENVVITGFIPNKRLPLYQAAADVLVMPYGRKICGSSGGDISKVINPMKMFDYMAVGRPIIASNIPVFHEVLHEKIAIFCEPENLDEWVLAIRGLMKNSERCEKMSIQAREEAEKYTWENRARETIARLEKILE